VTPVTLSAPIQRAIMAGERVTGVTVQWMARAMDAGDIILQREIEIGEDEDFGRLHDRLAAPGSAAVAEAVDLISRGQAPRIPQDHSQATYAPPITPPDLVVDWERPAAELVRLVRALSPQPGARTTRDGEILKLLAARPEAILPAGGTSIGSSGPAAKPPGPGKNNVPSGGIPGQVMELSSDGFLVMTGAGCLLVLRVQPAGRRAMSATDYLKGYRLQRGDRLGAPSRGADRPSNRE
jgi:methionyl-tRNA formyltransferase